MARALGVSQAYVSQIEAGTRPVSRKLAARLARLPGIPASVVPAGHARLDDEDADFAADLAALGYPAFQEAPAGRDPGRDSRDAGSDARAPKNPAAVIVAILSRRQVTPSVMAAIPWVLVVHADLDAAWLIDEARRRNLQNRLGFLTDLALEVARVRAAQPPSEHDSAALATHAGTPGRAGRLEALRADLETSRLANPDTLARVLTPPERQFFEEHRGAAARHWNLLTGLTVAQLPYK